jgi:FkbM family methyltransferase
MYLICFVPLGKQYLEFFFFLFRQTKRNNEFHSQQLQDVAALNFNLSKNLATENFYFVDIGAAYPEKYSNSHLLQKKGWSGLLVEPNPELFETLKLSRLSHNVKVAKYAIGSENKKTKLINSGPLSSVARNTRVDIYDQLRIAIAGQSESPIYFVDMLTPSTLLKTLQVPNRIDYLSLDTEGSELEILEVFPFEQYKVNFITCEHNYEWEYIEKIESLMKSKGFRRVLKCWSAQDAWFVNSTSNMNL